MSSVSANKSKSGAARSRRNTRTRDSDSFANILRVHRVVASSSLKRLYHEPASSLMTIFVVAVSLLLPTLLFALNSNLSSMLSGFQDNAQVTLYLKDGISNSSGLEVSNNLLTRTDINSANYVSPQQALGEFASSTGLENLVQELESNPLPGAIILSPTDASPDAVNSLLQQLQEIPEVALVQVDSRWLQRLAALSGLVSVIGRILSLIVLLGLFFIVGNTIKLAVENRKAEIRVIKLIGGSNMYAARPFLYSGLLYGLAGGIFAVVLQGIVLYAFNSDFEVLMQLYESEFQLQGFGPGNSLLIVLAGGTTGWAAALLASLRHIRSIDP